MVTCLINRPDGCAHVQTHLNTVPGVGGDGVGQTGHTVVTVAQDLDTKTSVLLKEFTARFNLQATNYVVMLK